MGVAVLRALVPWLSLAILSFAVAGCATTEQQTAAAVNGRILDDKFRPYREFQTGEIRVANTVGTGAKRLVARVDRKTGKATWILSFVIAYDGTGRHYREARNARAEPLQVRTVAHKSSNCMSGPCHHFETVEIDIPEAELRQAPAAGYQLKLLAKSGPDALIEVAKPVIDSLAAQVEADRAKG